MGTENIDQLVYTFATGAKKYLTTAKALAVTLRLQGTTAHLGLITDSDDPDLKNYFDVIVKPVPGYHHWFIKISALEAFPEQYKKFLFVDGDSLALKPLDPIWETFGGSDFAVTGTWRTKETDPDYRWYGDCFASAKKLGIERFANFNGGFFYFERTENTVKLFKRTMEIRELADGLGLQRNMGEVGDEVCISFASAELGIGTIFSNNYQFSLTPWGLCSKVHLDVMKGEATFIKRFREPVLVRPLIYHTAHARWDLRYALAMRKVLKFDRKYRREGAQDRVLNWRKPMILVLMAYNKLFGS